MLKQKSIRTRLIKYFVCIILISIIILEIILLNFVKQYYYGNLEETMTNQIMISSDFYSRYFSNSSLEENILDNIDVFWRQTPAQVQIINLSGEVLMDSIGAMPEEKSDTIDIKKGLIGQKGKWIGNVPYDSAKVMAISYPLTSDGYVVGVLRFITSLREVNKEIRSISVLFILIGLIVCWISAILSLFLANSIVEPLKEVTYAAGQMASGNFDERSQKRFNDEIGKLSDTLNFMAEEITKKDKLKNEFLSSVSHELRTPLTSIKGWAATLNSDNLDDKHLIKDGLTIIEKESDRLTAMVEELLDFSKFASGKIILKKRKIDITNVIEYVKDHMSPLAARNKVEFMVEYKGQLPEIEIDENRIKQVFINILDNAFKFTSQGGRVSFTAWVDDNCVNISIADNGCGISCEDLPRVKEKFFKGKNSKSQNGIGLSICDEIIKLHKGTFQIKSELGKGTEVILGFPINKSQ